MQEGTQPTISNGYTQFTDVRGDSGTRVTITLNQNAINAGLLDQDKVLKPLLTKFLESSPYSVVLEDCCLDGNEVKDIIHASEIEIEEIAKMQQGGNDDGDNIDDLNEEEMNENMYNNERDDSNYNSVKERSKYIPLRLSMGERKMLRLVEAIMSCCDYTTDVDKEFKSSTRRTYSQLKRIQSVLRGMVTSCDYNAGKKLLENDDDDNDDDENSNEEGTDNGGRAFSDYETFFRQMFEIARRHKIMNPEKMRSEYGKLIYLLQDAVSPSIQPHLSFSCKGSIETVYKFLEERNGLDMLEDKYIEIATREVLAGKKSRAQISHEIKQKEKAVSLLKQKYRTASLSSEDIHLCLYSIW